MLRLLGLYLPVLFPSWRFFKEVLPGPKVEVRIDGMWTEAMPRPAHVGPWTMLTRLFWNPRWNEALFVMSCAERMVVEPGDHAAREIRDRASRHVGAPGPLVFRLVISEQVGGVKVTAVPYQSDVSP